MKSAHVLVWFRRNLRLHDNAALNAAVASGLPITCVWVSQRPSENHNPRQSLFHYQAAQELHTRLAAHHIPLYVVASDEDLLPLAAALNAHTVITDEAYTEAEIRQDNHLWHNFDRAGIALQHANDRGILAKSPLMDANGLPYT
ncbi:MAG: deoxyribodipyrimidine photo-lyase, partial [Neisseria sp.]|nr:deoxyribodipyrimidine photo-lyase [Neisseria sp.]